AAADSSAAQTAVSEASCSGARHGAHSNGARSRRPAQNRQISRTASLTDWMSEASSVSCGSISFRPNGPVSSPTPIPTMTGLADQRVRGKSALVLTCLCTGDRCRIAAGSSLCATAAERFVSAHQDLELAQQGLAHEIRQVIVQGIAIHLQDPALPALARIENSALFGTRKGSAQTGPTAAPETGHRPMRLELASQTLDQRFELACRVDALRGSLDAKLSEWTRDHRRRAPPQCLLAVAAYGNELPQRFDGVLMIHAHLLAVPDGGAAGQGN